MLKAMADRGSRIVYATGIGRVCPTCGSGNVVAKLWLETKGRGGKTVTVVYDLPNNAEFLKSLATELKKACGTGGTIAEDTVEIQGAYRNRIRQLLMSKGWTVKG
jgi:translation initiation factor 1